MAATTAGRCLQVFSARLPEVDPRAPVKPRTLLLWLGLGFGAGGLILQFVLSYQGAMANGRDIPGFLGHFFTFYTILTNIALVLIYLSELSAAAWLALFRQPLVRGLMAASIALVGLYVFLVLRHFNPLEGPLLLADTLLHYLCPVLYLLWWLLQPHGALRWQELPLMLAPTFVYFLYAMARGLWVQEYPYPILNAIKLGYGQVGINALTMTAGLTVLCAVVILLDQFLSRQSRTAQ